MTSFWSAWIIILTVITIIGVTWLLFANRTDTKTDDNPTTGHVYDGIEEYDNPLPGWWFNLYLGTVIFAIAYLIVFPGLGNYQGYFKWTQIDQWQDSVETAEADFIENAKPFTSVPATELVENHTALRMGKRIFKSNCSTCHSADAMGTKGFPNLADHDWLWGGDEATIKQTITEGRKGSMPAWEAVLGKDLDAMANYVLSLSSDEPTDQAMHDKFQMLCSACHGKDGKGNQMLGAPNLADDIWLYGGALTDIRMSIAKGRNGVMPAHKDVLSPERIHLITAYLLSLSYEPALAAEQVETVSE